MCLCSCHLLGNFSSQVEQVVERSCSLVPTITTPPLLPTPSLASLWRGVAACLSQLLEVKREEVEEHTRQHRSTAPTASTAILRSVTVQNIRF